MKRSRSRQKARRAYRVSGFHTLAKALSRRGLSALDGRSAEARALKLWKAQVSADLGDDLSAQERTLLDLAAVDMALLTVADAWLRENSDRIVNRRRKTFVPLVRERLAVASHLGDQLKLLGLKRRPRPVPSLREILAQRTAEESSSSTIAPPVGAGAAEGVQQ